MDYKTKPQLLFLTTLGLSLCITFFSCGKVVEDLQSEEEIVNYLSTNNLNASQGSNGLYYIIDQKGLVDTSRSDSIPNSSSLVLAHLQGSLIDGTVFADSRSSSSNPIRISLSSNIISGLKQGFRLLRREGKATIFLPPTLAYGDAGDPIFGVPPFSVVIYKLELIDFYSSEITFNDSLIQAYINTANTSIDTTYNGMYLNIQDKGDLSETPSSTSTIQINLKGTLLSDTTIVLENTFLSTNPEEVYIPDVIEGLQETLVLFGVGGKGRVFIPSQEAYSAEGTDIVPNYEPLIYDFEIISVTP